jgi:leucyl aminopeptidase
MTLAFDVTRSAPKGVDALAVPVFTDGPVPRALGLSRGSLAAVGFDGSAAQIFQVPSATGPVVVAVGMGARADLTVHGVRNAAAALARAVARHEWVATTLADLEPKDGEGRAVGQAIAEGITMASYRFTKHRSEASNKPDAKNTPKLAKVALVCSAERAASVDKGAQRGAVIGDAVCFARDLANTSPGHLNATDMADVAQHVAIKGKLGIEIFDNDTMREMGMGGMIGVNKGSLEPARMIKLTYQPRQAQGTVALVGKGVMYDSGGISLKPSDASHASMKMDMSGAAAVLAAMSVLHITKPRVAVIAYLMCTDNMPSGSALKMGEVMTIRNGKTVEIHNTDAEGRLVLADGLSLAVEENVDAIVDIATLTGACMAALGMKYAGLLSNNDDWAAQVNTAASKADERMWRLPLVPEYRKLLDSEVADMKNIGGPYGGAITAGLFLQEFVGGKPWAHIDMAGPMRVDGDDGWLSKGATAYGVRTFVELLDAYRPPVS